MFSLEKNLFVVVVVVVVKMCTVSDISLLITTFSMTIFATLMGFETFFMEATAPMRKLSPSMMQASISISSSSLREAPVPLR